jgi:predicted GNAT family N-acyltransferase
MKTGTVAIGNASLHIGYSGIVPPNKRGLLREITEFFVPENQRGQGEGTSLLNDVCAQADDEHIILMIMADTPRLQGFYARHGFVTIQDGDDILMARKPK